MASGPITSWQIGGEKVEAVTDFSFLGSKFTAESDWSHEVKRHLLIGRKAMTNVDSILKIRDINFANKNPYSQSYGFSSSYVQMWEVDCKEGWEPKNLYFWMMVLENTHESLLNTRRKTSQS